MPGSSRRGFAISLYLEHLEEASFLYEQRRDDLLDEPELAWTALDDFEERLEAHLDGLVLGDDLALAVCRQQVEEGDTGELHAAVRVFCRHERKDLLEEVLDGLDTEDEERVQAVAEALCHELPDTWQEAVTDLLFEGDAMLRGLAARVIGYRRIPAAEALLHVLPACRPEALPGVLWALGRLRDPAASQPLYNLFLSHEEEAVRAAAAHALLRIKAAVQPHLLRQVHEASWTLLPAGLCGGGAAVAALLETLSENPQPDGLLALGLLGDVAAVEALLYYLEEEQLAEAAATALNLITGAALFEEVFVPEEFDEDELFEEEREALARGESLLTPGGEVPGTEVTRLSQEVTAWRAWWRENGRRFQPGLRYRSGRLYTPAALLETLLAERMPRRVRGLAYEELVIRYGFDAPFETDLWARHQRQALAALAAQIEAAGDQFRAGKWYLTGRLMP